MKKLLPFCLCAALFSGCAPVLIATGAVAGYAVSRDSVMLEINESWDKIWTAVQEEVREQQGHVKRENPPKGRLDASVEGCDVTVTLKRWDDSTVRVIVRARKNLLPKVDVAQRLALGIQRRAEKGLF